LPTGPQQYQQPPPAPHWSHAPALSEAQVAWSMVLGGYAEASDAIDIV